MIARRLPPAWVIGLAAAVIAAAAAVAAFFLPATVLNRADWHDAGLRLFRDDHEMSVYFDRSSWLQAGAPPYTPGHEQEYPPLGVIYYSLPRLFFTDLGNYEKGFAALNVVMFGLLAGLTARLLRRYGQPLGRLALFFLPAFLYCSLWRFDLLPAVLVALFLLAVSWDKPVTVFIVLAAAILAKFYPVLFFLPLVMFLAGRRPDEKTRKRLGQGLLALAAVVAAVLAAVALTAGFGAVVYPILFHLGRNFEMGSLGLTVLVGLFLLGISGLFVGRLTALVFLLLQFGATIVLMLRGRLTDQRSFIRACLFVLLPFLIFSNFFSPQWILWLTPVYILVASRREIAALIALDAVVYLQFPVVFGIDPYGWPYLLVSLGRSAVMVYLAYLNIKAMTAAGVFAGRRSGGPVQAGPVRGL